MLPFRGRQNKQNGREALGERLESAAAGSSINGTPRRTKLYHLCPHCSNPYLISDKSLCYRSSQPSTMCEFELTCKIYDGCKLPDQIQAYVELHRLTQGIFSRGALPYPEGHTITVKTVHLCEDLQPEPGSSSIHCFGERLKEKEEVQSQGKTTLRGQCPACLAADGASVSLKCH